MTPEFNLKLRMEVTRNTGQLVSKGFSVQQAMAIAEERARQFKYFMETQPKENRLPVEGEKIEGLLKAR